MVLKYIFFSVGFSSLNVLISVHKVSSMFCFLLLCAHHILCRYSRLFSVLLPFWNLLHTELVLVSCWVDTHSRELSCDALAHSAAALLPWPCRWWTSRLARLLGSWRYRINYKFLAVVLRCSVLSGDMPQGVEGWLGKCLGVGVSFLNQHSKQVSDRRKQLSVPSVLVPCWSLCQSMGTTKTTHQSCLGRQLSWQLRSRRPRKNVLIGLGIPVVAVPLCFSEIESHVTSFKPLSH